MTDIKLTEKEIKSLHFLKRNNIFFCFKKNFDKHLFLKYRIGVSSLLECAFYWKNTKEGYEFWYFWNNKLRNYLISLNLL